MDQLWAVNWSLNFRKLCCRRSFILRLPLDNKKKQKANKRARKNLVGGEKGIIQARMGKSISSHQFYVSIFMVKENDVNKLFYKLTRGIRDSFAGWYWKACLALCQRRNLRGIMITLKLLDQPRYSGGIPRFHLESHNEIIL